MANARIQKVLLGKVKTSDLAHSSRAAQETEEAARQDRIGAYLTLLGLAVQHAVDALVAVNPGTNTCASYLDFADILLIYEDGTGDFVHWSPPDWAASVDPRHLWILVHSEVDPSAMQSDLAHAAESGIGWVYVTDDVLPNPWDTLPAYWSAEVAAR